MTKELKPLKSILFVSRNKDNKHLPDFKERRYVRLTTKTAEELKKDFENWSAQGRDGEFCRFYMKINARDRELVKKNLIKELIFNDNFDLVAAEAKIAGIANKKECAAERKWLFDFDDTEDKLEEFINDIKDCDKASVPLEIEVHKTPNGHAVIVSRGFDTRELMKKWSATVELKKDEMLCVNWTVRRISWKEKDMKCSKAFLS